MATTVGKKTLHHPELGPVLFTVERKEIVGTVYEDYNSMEPPELVGLKMILDYIRDNAGEDCSLEFEYHGNRTMINARYTTIGEEN